MPPSARSSLRDIVIKSIFAFFLGVPLYLAVRRALRPALIEERAAPAARPAERCIGSLEVLSRCICAPTNARPR